MNGRLIGTLVLVHAIAAGCGGDKPAGTVDAAKSFDAKPSSVHVVDCSTVPNATAIAGTAGFTFSPSAVTISAGQDSAISYTTTGDVHGMVNDTGTDAFNTGTLSPGDNAVCLKFSMPGVFHYHCTVHGTSMAGTVTVQ